MKSMAASFFIHGRIKTTEAKAKALRPYVERTLTRAGTPTVANRRLLSAASSPRTATYAIRRAGELNGRPGGYTRIMKMGPRKGDSANMALLELIP